MTEAPLIDPLKDPNAELLNPKRRKGAPKGNKNALRHGFYAKNLGLSSPSKLDEFEMRNLMGEAAMPWSARPRGFLREGSKTICISSTPVTLRYVIPRSSPRPSAPSRSLVWLCRVFSRSTAMSASPVRNLAQTSRIFSMTWVQLLPVPIASPLLSTFP